jgi:hypothetical protein
MAIKLMSITWMRYVMVIKGEGGEKLKTYARIQAVKV